MVKELREIFAAKRALDKKSVEFLCNALAANSLQGFDYIKFKQSLRALQNMQMEESLAMKSAFATAATLGMTKEKLLATAEHYKEVLNKEHDQFEEALKKQMHQKVASKHDETLYLKEKIEEYRSKIADLEKQIEDAQKKVNVADSEIKQAREKIENTKEKFTMTYENFLEQIQKDIEMINIHL